MQSVWTPSSWHDYFPTFSAIFSCRVHMSMRFGLPMRHCQCGVWKNVTLCDPNQRQNVEQPLPAFSNVLLNATLFKCDLLESYESPTISTISGRNAIKQPWEKDVKYIGKVQWLFVVMFSTYFLPNQMNIGNVKVCTKSNLCPQSIDLVEFSTYVLPYRFYKILRFAKWLKARATSVPLWIRTSLRERERIFI